MKTIISASLSIAAAVIMAVSCNGSGNKNKSTDEPVDSLKTDSTMTAQEIQKLPEEPIFDIVTSMGTIKVKLYSKTPQHKANFIKLASEHFYDSTFFHRVINKFMIQGGDPYTKDTTKAGMYGQGGPGYTIPAEIVNQYYHKKGALAAARKGDFANPTKASSGSQFYIVQDENNCLHLDGQYTIFGETVAGLDVIDKIASVETDELDRPYDNIYIISIKPDTAANAALLGEKPAEEPKDTTK